MFLFQTQMGLKKKKTRQGSCGIRPTSGESRKGEKLRAAVRVLITQYCESKEKERGSLAVVAVRLFTIFPAQPEFHKIMMQNTDTTIVQL